MDSLSNIQFICINQIIIRFNKELIKKDGSRQMDFKKIQLPIQIQQQPQYTRSISTVCQQLYKQTQYLRSIIESTHDIYGILSKSISKQADAYQEKLIQKDDAFANRLVTFIRSVNNIFTNIQHQVNNSIVMLRTKDNKVIKKRMEILIQKLDTANQEFQKYLTAVHDYNKQGTQYIKKAQYFSDFENNPIKYYSKNQATKKYQKCNKRQFQLRRKLEAYFKLKKDVQLTIRQLRVGIKQYYTMFTQNLQDYKKISFMLRQKLIMLGGHNDAVIEEVTQEDQHSVKEKSIMNSRDRYKKIGEYSDLNARKRSRQLDYQTQTKICLIFQAFLVELGNSIKKAEDMIGVLWESKQFQQFQDTRSILATFIQPDMQQNRDACIKQIANFKKTFSRLVGHLNKVKLFEQITKIREQNCRKYNSQIHGILDSERLKSNRSQLINQYFLAEQKHDKSDKQYMARYKQYVMELEILIHKQFQFRRADSIIPKSKSFGNQSIEKGAGIFEYKYFSVLNLPYFISKKEQQPQFCSSKHIQNYLRVMNANKLQQIHLDWQYQQSSNRINRKKNQSSFLGCCGLPPRKKQAKTQADSFTCAVKDGYFLLQGTMTIYPTAVRFFSMFGKKSVLRSTQIIIPKSQILGLIKDRYISLMIIFRTVHGDIQFTSFISDPYDMLISKFPDRELGSQRSSSANSNIKKGMQAQKMESQDFQMQMVQNNFKNNFHRFLQEESIYLDQIQIVPRQRNTELVILTSYHQKQSGSAKHSITLKPGKFQIKLTKVNGVFESVYNLDQMCSSETRRKLIKATKKVIHFQEHQINNSKKRQKDGQFKNANNNIIAHKLFESLEQFPNPNNSMLNRQFNNISRIVKKDSPFGNPNNNTTLQDLRGFQLEDINLIQKKSQPFFKSAKKLRTQQKLLRQGFLEKQQQFQDKVNRNSSFRNSTSDISDQQGYIKTKEFSMRNQQIAISQERQNRNSFIRKQSEGSNQCFKSISQIDSVKNTNLNYSSIDKKQKNLLPTRVEIINRKYDSNRKSQKKNTKQFHSLINTQTKKDSQSQGVNFFEKHGINPLWLVLGLFGLLSILSRVL